MIRSAALLLLFLLAAGCGGRPEALPAAPMRIGDTELVVEVARRLPDRHRGLSGRPTLLEGHGMLFAYAEPGRPEFTMRGMAFDLDLIWIRDGAIVGISPDVPARPEHRGQTYRAPEAVDCVLEVAAGTARANGWTVGTSARLLEEPTTKVR